MRALPRISKWRPGLVGSFALASLMAFAVLWGALSLVVARQVTRSGEESAQFHAEFVTNSILRYELTAHDLAGPLRGRAYRRLDRFVRARILQPPVVRVKIWSVDGTVLYSDEPRLVGARFDGDPDPVAATGKRTVSEVTDLSEPENAYERGLASKLFATYVPLYLPGASRARPPGGVVELYQDYSLVQATTRSLFHTRLLTLGAGLLILYIVLLPIAFRTSRRVRRQNDLLEEQARRLEVLLAREQQTVGELRRLNQMQSDFAAVASHELRTPLTAILGYVKTLQRPEFEQNPVARREFLAAMERQGDRLFRLVANLLSAAQVENRDTTLDIATFAFGELAEEVREGFHDSAERIRLAISPDLPPIETDRDRVAEILANLVDNSLKYSLAETPVELGATASEGRLRFWVADHGIGIDPVDLDRIFDRFYQTDQSSTRRYGGVGLGLHLVKQLAETLGGTVEVESEPGVGSTFTVTLPLWRGPGPAGNGSAGAQREAESLQQQPQPAAR
ncbi:MAG: HAMP domain-containing histidine kinase [Actinomycetota bacterium]|nr:HAMP domain-containing histidine kinase [Actinomycetota bacterium]